MLSNLRNVCWRVATRQSSARLFPSICVALAALLFVAPQPAKSAELKISFAELAGLVNEFAGDVSIRLNNYSSGIFDFSSGSSLTFGGNSIPLDKIKAYSFERFGSTYAYYLNDINSTSVSVTAVSGAVRVRARFESENAEGVGGCVSGGCSLANSLPDIQWARPAVSLDLVPIAIGDSIALKLKKVSIGGRLSPTCQKSTGWAGLGCQLILPLARYYVSKIERDMDRVLMEAANKPDVQEKLAEKLQPYLVLGPAGEVRIQRVSNNSTGVSIKFCIGC